jgi:hypothetical protein
MPSALKPSITFKDLNSLVAKNKKKVLKTFNSRGYIENLGVKEIREVDEKCMQISHNGMAVMSDRIQAGAISMEFRDWVDSL